MSTVCCAARRGPVAPMGGSWARVLARHFHWCDGLRGARSMDGRTTCQGHGETFRLALGKNRGSRRRRSPIRAPGRAAPDHRRRAQAIRAGGFNE